MVCRSICAVGVIVCAAGAYAQPNDLDPFLGRDLWRDRPSQSEEVALAKLVGAVPNDHLAPWRVWKLHGEPTRYAVLLGGSLMVIPGGSSACVQLFDASAVRLDSWCFQAGWRIGLTGASMEFYPAISSDVIVLQVTPVITGRDIAKEYFSIGNGQLKLVRLENSQGEAAQNVYAIPNFEIGLVPAHTIQQWADMLESKDPTDVLSALVFLGGQHLSDHERGLLPGLPESKSSERIRELIKGLTGSRDQWIRQAATLAARGPRDRPLW